MGRAVLLQSISCYVLEKSYLEIIDSFFFAVTGTDASQTSAVRNNNTQQLLMGGSQFPFVRASACVKGHGEQKKRILKF